MIESLSTATSLSIGVFQVEVRGDGRRGEVMRALMARGFSYVGQIRGAQREGRGAHVFTPHAHMQASSPCNSGADPLTPSP